MGGQLIPAKLVPDDHPRQPCRLPPCFYLVLQLKLEAKYFIFNFLLLFFPKSVRVIHIEDKGISFLIKKCFTQEDNT